MIGDQMVTCQANPEKRAACGSDLYLALGARAVARLPRLIPTASISLASNTSAHSESVGVCTGEPALAGIYNAPPRTDRRCAVGDRTAGRQLLRQR